MDIITLAGTAIVAAALCVVVKQYRPEAALGISLACGIVIFAAVLVMLAPAISTFSALSERAGLENGFAQVLLKALAVCWITQIAADGCRDAGETAIASKLELAGRAAVLVISLPVFTQLAELITGLLGGM